MYLKEQFPSINFQLSNFQCPKTHAIQGFQLCVTIEGKK